MFMFNVVTIILSLVPIEISKRLIDEAIPSKDLNTVISMIGLIIVIYVIIIFISYAWNISRVKFPMLIARHIREDFMKKLLHIPFSHHTNLSEGQLMEIILDDVGDLVDDTFELILTPILNLVAVLITLTYMFYTSATLTAVAFAFLPLFLITTIPLNNLLRKQYQQVKSKSSNLYSSVEEKLAGLNDIITHNKVDYETEDFIKKVREYQDAQYNYSVLSTKLESTITIIGNIAPYIIILFAIYYIITGKFEVGTLVAFTMLAPQLFEPIKELTRNEMNLQELVVSSKRVFSIVHDAKNIQDGDIDITPKSLKGEIEIRNVNYGYYDTKIFDNLSMKIKPNRITAICGKNGIGKSTIFNLILRTLDPKQGEVLLDGKNIRQFKITSLRHNIAFVSQKPFLFSNTIMYNILYGHSNMNASIEEVIKAAKDANIHDVITNLPKGYHTHINETTNLLSQGQAHRITLARANLRVPKIYLLDEPTLGFDTKSTNHLLEVLQRMKKNRTVIVITNDINITKFADKIIILERKGDNTAVESTGIHKELLKKSKIYRELIGINM